MRILETREENYQNKDLVECDRNPPLSASSVTFYQNTSLKNSLLSRIGPQEVNSWNLGEGGLLL